MSDSLHALSPIDGRYFAATSDLRVYFSEAALFRYRLIVEIEYFIELSKDGFPLEGKLTAERIATLRSLYADFSDADAVRIKEIEKTTNHDIKALEYFIKEKLDAMGMNEVREWVHFGLTSQDINNTAIPLSLKEANEHVIFPAMEGVIVQLSEKVDAWKPIPMLARTHGQPASPTLLGKEFDVFRERLQIQVKQLKASIWAAKFGGATGNFNAHHVAFPSINWIDFSNELLQRLGLTRSHPTTQIEHYDHLAAYCHNLMRINTILIDLCRDVWTYISMDYFTQKVKAGEVGSSAMPHKVNPIDFENAEGNLGYANAILAHLAEKLPVSRLQRDLTDSTVLRNVGVPLAHCLIALKSLQRGIDKLLVNENAIRSDLERNAVVLAEAIQTILRREGFENPYEMLKDLTRGKARVTLDDIRAFIENLKVSPSVKMELLALDPATYTGIAEKA
jgi:adenylosuccinate lyase